VLTVTTVGAVGVVGGVVGHSQLRERLAERRAADTVELQATLRVSSSSSSPIGGRVDYYLTLHNTGPRVIRIARLRVREAGLSITSRPVSPLDVVRSGQTLYLPLSVRLDCRQRAPARRPDVLRGAVSVQPPNGRWRRVTTSFTRASPLTDVADTLCSLNPAFRSKELSGPVLP